MDDKRNMRLAREELVFEDAGGDLQMAVQREWDQSEYNRIKENWASSLPRYDPPRAGLGVSEVSLHVQNGDIQGLFALIRARIFKALPLRLIKLPEMVLTERGAVANHIIHNRYDHLVEEWTKVWYRPKGITSLLVLEPDISALVNDVTKFAILSHTWGSGEPSHEDFLLKRNTTSDGHKKLEAFCRIAHEQFGVEFAWADTVCIDKRSSSELDESIRSMFTWYRESSICIIYLADTDTFLNLPLDRWFTRGWTLQELLAPLRIKFYNKNWQPITNLRNEKLDPKAKFHDFHPDYASYLSTFDQKYPLQLKLLGDAISAATGIPIQYIYNFQSGIRNPSLPERMKWIARRVTTRPEDMTYSMMGVLGVSISIAYGEGSERAFFRLFQAMLEVDWSPSWFLWGGKAIPPNVHPSRMIPSSPLCYSSWEPECDSSRPMHRLDAPVPTGRQLEDRRSWVKREPIALTNVGLPINVLIVPVKAVRHALGGERIAHATITCPLSDDTVRREIPLHNGGGPYDEIQFGIGILDFDTGASITSKSVSAFLLYRVCAPGDSGATEAARAKEWRYTEWKRWETGEIVFFTLKNRFHKMKVEEWFNVEITKSEVGWEDNGHRSPKIEVLYLYL